ncbi:MAG: hypothetical protein RsTaC01_0207 [Candidatus Paraimprobicoccus trichonymphae]|uniref:Uncharacterized protein n=1 Tax=Candidatus Paraimprobicoccus trichonymphae TaxID=3033793 RepID=A0AA48KZP1_9FIRM|nr:MAG: hypothetical protein RsTaC01_0207 [Candidatus Paraimprobicoccus trichonymphae]
MFNKIKILTWCLILNLCFIGCNFKAIDIKYPKIIASVSTAGLLGIITKILISNSMSIKLYSDEEAEKCIKENDEVMRKFGSSDIKYIKCRVISTSRCREFELMETSVYVIKEIIKIHSIINSVIAKNKVFCLAKDGFNPKNNSDVDWILIKEENSNIQQYYVYIKDFKKMHMREKKQNDVKINVESYSYLDIK